ncbi:MAG: glycosyltransferase family 39 protein [Deltaproteobacteria bacterium]|nr:glycosyltransferase family 39 protein [Deltaproteobacteria bacterium]
MKKFQPLLIKLAPWILLSAFAFICYTSQIEKSVTVDEFIYLPAGLYNLITLDWRMDRENPPLIKCFPALTALISKPEINIKTFNKKPNPYDLAYDFMFRNKERYRHIFQYGRCAVILLGCLCGWLLYKFAVEIYGFRGALFALFLFVFNPNVLAHSRLTTIDMGATLTIFLSIYCFWKYLKLENGTNAIIAGIALGVAQLSKFTALILYPIFIIIFVVFKMKKRHGELTKPETSLTKSVALLIAILIVSLLIINAGYLFSGSFIPMNEFTFSSGPMKLLSSLCWGILPVPLPSDHILGFDTLLAFAEGNHPFYVSYLMGEHSLSGWWYYYFIAFFVKNPLVLSIIVILTIYVWVKKKADRPSFETRLCIWIPIIGFFTYFSFFTHIPIGIRWLLPIFPLLFLAAGYLFKTRLMRGKWASLFTTLMIIGYLTPAIFVFPNYLSYFNLAAGGSSKGHRWLIDSNLDWGQDLPGLKKYMEQKGIKKINLGYFGRVDPKIYGIDYTIANREADEGISAISINFLVGRPYYLLNEKSKELSYIDLNHFENYRSLKPQDVIGHTIYIFSLGDDGI